MSQYPYNTDGIKIAQENKFRAGSNSVVAGRGSHWCYHTLVKTVLMLPLTSSNMLTILIFLIPCSFLCPISSLFTGFHTCKMDYTTQRQELIPETWMWLRIGKEETGVWLLCFAPVLITGGGGKLQKYDDDNLKNKWLENKPKNPNSVSC